MNAFAHLFRSAGLELTNWGVLAQTIRELYVALKIDLLYIFAVTASVIVIFQEYFSPHFLEFIKNS